MFKNHLVIFVRNFLRHKGYYFLNIAGLTTALVTAIAILLYTSHELSYDHFHKNKTRIFRVIQGDDSDEQSSSVPFPTGPSLLNDYTDLVQEATRIFNFQASSLGIVVEDGVEKMVFNEPRFFFADSAYFKIFDHEFISGTSEKSLSGPGMIVLTESMSRKLFKTTDAIGKIIKFEGKHDMVVTAVIADVPDNAHFQFDYLASFETLKVIFDNDIPEKNWYWNPVWTYVLLRDGASVGALQDQMPFFVKKYFHPSLVEQVKLEMQPITEIYLKSKSDYEISTMSDIRYTYIFASIGIFILVVAAINFINLSTAQASDRFKEIGIRKVMGAGKRSVARQFLSESYFISVISGLMAIVLFLALLPWINDLAGKNFSAADIFQWKVILGILTIVFFCGSLSGTYPAWALASLQPAKILKDKTSIGSGTFRQILVALQFTVSIVLIILTLIIEKQINFLKESNTGFSKEQVIAISVQRTEVVQDYTTFKERILVNKEIENVSTSNTLIGKDFQSSNYKVEGREEKLYPCIFVRNDFLKTMNIPLLSGKDFSDSLTSKGYRAIINRTFMEDAGWSSPADAVGKIIEGTLEGPLPVLGVCEDFAFAPLKQASGPVILVQTDYANAKDFFTRFIYVKVQGENVSDAIAFLEKTWNDFAPDSPFEFFFLDEALQQVYLQEEKFSTLGKVFGTIAIIIGSLGLWGLSAYYVQKRKKEISIRKTLGASFGSLSLTLSKDFMKPVLAACCIGIPLSFYLISRWLEDFANRTQISSYLFGVGAIAVITISLTVVMIQLVRGTRANPAEVLREG
ncbi:MAG TPA: FtsX-like permease family protein [Chryseosolibacter sp.]|nr:FtsX-like permease family protein [Chryseosolibacter sp.]